MPHGNQGGQREAVDHDVHSIEHPTCEGCRQGRSLPGVELSEPRLVRRFYPSPKLQFAHSASDLSLKQHWLFSESLLLLYCHAPSATTWRLHADEVILADV